MDIRELYKKIADANFKELNSQRHELITDIQAILPNIVDFTGYLLNLDFENDEIKREVVTDINEILKDIMQAIENDDEVLMMDATAYGLLEYMRMLLSECGLELDDSEDE